jgi:DNA-damage-inducible protein D
MGKELPMSELTIFHFTEGEKCFEDIGKPNGVRLWREHDLMTALDYQAKSSFRKVITRAMQACLSLNIRTEENFIPDEQGDYLLTRFACYLVAMNGDPKKPNVAAAQFYFAAIAETFQHHLEHADGIERVLIREEMTDSQKALGSTAKQHGVQNYAFFLNQGYRGMYNMDLASLTSFKGVSRGQKLLDRMGKTELAANLFRITQTDEKIKNQGIRGQRKLEDAAFQVGRKVRETMMGLSGSAPEHLPIAPPITDVKKRLKETSKKLKNLDKKRIEKKENEGTEAEPPQS